MLTENFLRDNMPSPWQIGRRPRMVVSMPCSYALETGDVHIMRRPSNQVARPAILRGEGGLTSIRDIIACPPFEQRSSKGAGSWRKREPARKEQMSLRYSRTFQQQEERRRLEVDVHARSMSPVPPRTGRHPKPAILVAGEQRRNACYRAD